MSTSLTPEAWTQVIQEEYLQGFIRDGGATVKFAVPSGREEHGRLVRQLKDLAESNGYLYVVVDSATTKVHMIDKVFHAVAKQVAWDDLATAFLRSMLSGDRYLLPDEGSAFNLEQLAALNGLGHDLGEMRRQVNIRLRDRLYCDYAMTQDFRIAMLRLCGSQLDPQVVGTGIGQAVKEYLCGELRLMSALKSAFIFQKIGRHNGRHMLFSLAHWLHVTGKAGLVIVLDISRFSETKRPVEPDGGLYYSTPAVLDGYEVLRQLVDGTDELEYCLTVVVAPPDILDPDDRRGVQRYPALYSRISDEVRDRERPNPLSPLVRLAAEAGHTGEGGPQ